MRVASVDTAVTAAVAVAVEHGIPVDDPVVLWDGANTMVHLRPAPVVARVAAATALVRPDPAGPLRREVALSGWLAERGVPVVPPSGLLPAGPHVVHGRVVSLWQYVPTSGPADGHPVAVATMLAALHDVLPRWTGPMPGVEEILGDVVRSASLPGLPLSDPVRSRLLDAGRLADAVAAVDAVPLHGDPHPGNALQVGGTMLWNDLEDSWRGPLEWDLTVLARSRRHDGEAALAAYRAVTGVRPDVDLMAACGRVRAVQALAWTALLEAYRGGVFAAR